jgi:hypothetical protein
MADTDTISVSKLLEFAKTIGGDAVEQVQKFIEHTGKGSDAVVSFSEIAGKGFDKVVAGVKELQKQMGAGVAVFGEFKEATKEAGKLASSVFDQMISGVEDYTKKVNLTGPQWVIAFEPLFHIIPQAITGLGKIGDAGEFAGSQISTAFKAVGPMMKVFFGEKVSDFFGEMAKGSDKVINVQRAIVATAAAQGHLTSVISDSDKTFKGLNQEYQNFVDLNYSTAHDTHQSVEAITDLYEVVKDLPGVFDKSITIGNNSMGQMAAMSRMAAGFGVSNKSIGDELHALYERVGTEGKKAEETIANLHERAGDSKLRFPMFSKSVLDMADSFKMLGDNTDSATNIVSTFDDVLGKSNISPEALKQVVDGLGAGIKKMSEGQKAFVSAQTGGPGGLAGAFEIDYAIKEGKMDEVIKKTMSAMQNQFGGQVVTLKDVHQNANLAGQLQKQVQYLTEVAGIAGDKNQAYQLLEAMKSGVTDKLKVGAGTTGKPLEDAVGRGVIFQEQSKNILMETHQTMEKIRLLQAGTYYRMGEQNEFFKAGRPVGMTKDKSAQTGLFTGERSSGSAIEAKANKQLEDIMRDTEVGRMLSRVGGSITDKIGGADTPGFFKTMTSILEKKPTEGTAKAAAESIAKVPVGSGYTPQINKAPVGIEYTPPTRGASPATMAHHGTRPGTESGVPSTVGGHRLEARGPVTPGIPFMIKSGAEGADVKMTVDPIKFEPLTVKIIAPDGNETTQQLALNRALERHDRENTNKMAGGVRVRG